MVIPYPKAKITLIFMQTMRVQISEIDDDKLGLHQGHCHGLVGCRNWSPAALSAALDDVFASIIYARRDFCLIMAVRNACCGSFMPLIAQFAGRSFQ